jgi:peptide/nickel transport system permease protein
MEKLHTSQKTQNTRRGLSVKKIWRIFAENKSLVFGGIVLGIMLIMAVFADIVSPYHYTERFSGPFGGSPPSEAHPLGTTSIGFDVLARIIYGTRVALIMALSGTILAFVIGFPLGIFSGFLGGKVDRLLTLIADAIYSFPSLLLAITFAIYLSGFGILEKVAAVAFATATVYIPTYFRVVRSQVLQLKNEGYIHAARSMGAGRLTIIVRYVIPNVVASTIAIIPFNMTDAILTNAGLAFLGLGIEPPTADWGYDVYENRTLSKVRSTPWLIFFPGFMIFLLSFTFALIGDALNDKFNPLLRQKNKK